MRALFVSDGSVMNSGRAFPAFFARKSWIALSPNVRARSIAKFAMVCTKCSLGAEREFWLQHEISALTPFASGKEFGPKGFGYGASVQSTPDATPSPGRFMCA